MIFCHIVKPRSSWETSLHEFNQITFHALVQINKNISSVFTCTLAVHCTDPNSASYGDVTRLFTLYRLVSCIVKADYHFNRQNWTFHTQLKSWVSCNRDILLQCDGGLDVHKSNFLHALALP